MPCACWAPRAGRGCSDMTNESGSGATSSSASGTTDVVERRRSPRRSPGFTESLRRVRSRTGRDLDVVDVSHTGLLVEGQPRLLPNTHLDIHIVTRDGRVLIRCRVVRAFVWYLERDLVRYRTGLAFDRDVDTSIGYPVLATSPYESREEGMAYPGLEPQRSDATTGPRSS